MPSRRRTDRQPRLLLPALLVTIVLGALSVVTTVQQGQQAQLARQAQVAETTRLVEQLDAELAARAEFAGDQRETICEIVRDVALELDLAPPDCPEDDR